MHHTLAASLAILAFVATAQATTMMPVQKVCPIGGEKYESFEIMSTSQFRMRLDLRPNGPAAHLPWDQCPNGFVVWKDKFTPEEIAKLTPVVASEEFQRMRKEHVTAYLVVHLRRALGASDADLAWLVLKAAWEAEETKEDFRQRYLVEAQIAMNALAKSRTSHDEEWWSASIVTAEIARQRGRFPEALELLAALPVNELKADDVKRAVIDQIKAHANRRNARPADFVRPG
jgi:hypothetical protein